MNTLDVAGSSAPVRRMFPALRSEDSFWASELNEVRSRPQSKSWRNMVTTDQIFGKIQYTATPSGRKKLRGIGEALVFQGIATGVLKKR